MKQSSSASKSNHDLRNCIGCALAFLLLFLIVNPFVDFPFNDDWSYAFTVKQLLLSGHLVYNRWSAPLIITQAYWGGAFARVFGFSHTVLRFSTLPFAIGSVVVCYLLSRRLGLGSRWSVTMAMVLATSPVFLPLSTSFMTDVPCLFSILFSIYALGESARKPPGFGWLAVSVVAAILGGLSRQIAWIVPVTSLPMMTCIYRKRATYSLACVVGFFITICTAFIALRWFARQPNVVLDNSIADTLRLIENNFSRIILGIIRTLFTTGILLLPVLFTYACFIIADISAFLQPRRLMAISIFGFAFGGFLIANPLETYFPWMGTLITPNGYLSTYQLSGTPPRVTPPELIDALSILTIFCLMIVLGCSFERCFVFRNWTSFRHRVCSTATKQPLPLIIICFLSAYFVLLIPRMAHGWMFDRYVLEFVPFIGIALLSAIQKTRKGRFSRVICVGSGTILFGLYCFFSIGSTHDLMALSRAQKAAIALLEESNVKPNQIAAGFEWDCWEQLELTGYVNFSKASNKIPASQRSNLQLQPDLRCLYRIEHNPHRDTIPSAFPPIEYQCWLPPFHRTISIDTFVNSQWAGIKQPGEFSGIPASWEDFFVN